MKPHSFFLLSAYLLVTGCSPMYYTPNTQNVPLIESKGQTNLSFAGNANQVEFQSAYGLTRSLGLELNGGLIFPADLANGNGGSGRFLEAGVGYFKTIGKKFLFESYELIGYGNMENHLPSTLTVSPFTTGNLSANLLRVGFQPGLSFLTKYFSITGSFRLASLNYSKIGGNLVFDNANQVNFLTANKSTFIFEPALTLRAGPERIKLQIQLAKSWNLTNKDFRQDNNLLSLGLNVNFK